MPCANVHDDRKGCPKERGGRFFFPALTELRFYCLVEEDQISMRNYKHFYSTFLHVLLSRLLITDVHHV